MKKYIVAFDGLRYSHSSRDYAIRLAKDNHAHLVGIMLNDITHHSFNIYDLVSSEGGVSVAKQNKLLRADQDTRKRAADDFHEKCTDAGVEYTLHYDRCIAIQELIHESVYADLLIIDENENFTFAKDRPPTEFIKDLLPQVQCPVLIVPHIYTPINASVLLYDGEPSSVFAVKMFSNTLPSFKPFDAEVITVKDIKSNSHLPDNKLMKEFMKRHYPEAKYTVLKGNPEMLIIDSIRERTDFPLVVLGAYRRNMVSRWFRRSMADILMKELKNPLFIAHT